MWTSSDARERAGRVRLLLLDVDGILTDGRILVGPDGEERKAFHARDGLGIRLAGETGLEVGFLSGRASRAVEARAAELGLSEVHLGARDKSAVFAELLARRSLSAREVGYAGDDLVDLPVMVQVALAATVPEADEEIRRRAHVVTARSGGDGAVREIIEFVLRARGLWPGVLARFASGTPT